MAAKTTTKFKACVSLEQQLMIDPRAIKLVFPAPFISAHLAVLTLLQKEIKRFIKLGMLECRWSRSAL